MVERQPCPARPDVGPASHCRRWPDHLRQPLHVAPSPFVPGCAKTCLSQGCAELLSQFPSLDRAGKCNWFSHRQNREGISTRKLNVRVFTQPGRVEDGRGSLGHSATLRFPSHRVAGGGRPPPAPTERGVRISRTTLFGSWFTAFTAICSSFVSMVS